MNVLSLFDGMSCGRIALDRAGIDVDQYYASELDKHAIAVTQANWPDTVQLGDVTNWREWDIDWSSIDLLIGGSPCQGFSFAGKQLAFDDPRSKLFFVYVDILNHIRSLNPDVKFMLENVKMKKGYIDVISEQLGVEPVFINSALVSAQNRQRFYWANWSFNQPEDKGIVLADILETGYADRDKSLTVTTRIAGATAKRYLEKSMHQMAIELRPASIVGRKLDENGKRNDTLDQKLVQCLEVQSHQKSRCLSTVAKDTVISPMKPGRYPLHDWKDASDKNPEIKGDYLQLDPNQKKQYSQCNRINLPHTKHKSLSGTSGGNKHGVADADTLMYRKLTPEECEALQTVPRGYTAHVSNTQRYKMLGNGWTVDVIAHIFSSMNC